MTLEILTTEYVGKEVIVETSQVIIGGESYPTYSCQDTIVEELTNKLEVIGFGVRVFLPDTMGDCGYRTDRANIMIAQTPESDKFTIANIGIG